MLDAVVPVWTGGAGQVVFLAGALAASSLIVWYWRGLVRTGAALGSVLIALVLWVETLPRRAPGGARPGEWPDIALSLGMVGLVIGGLFILIREVLAHDRQQAALLAEAETREARLEQAASLAKLGHYVFDMVEDRMLYCSDRHARSHGLDRSTFMQSAASLSNDMPLVHPPDRAALREAYRAVIRGETVETEYRVPTENGMRWVREVVAPVRDGTGRVVRGVGTTLDVTEQRELEERLRASARAEAIGNLTGGVAHDFNNIMAVILGNLELMREAPDDADNLIDEAIAATLRGAGLTRNLLSFARRAPLEPRVLQPVRVVHRARAWAETNLGPDHRLRVEIADATWPVKLDPTAIENALINLIQNARDAMPEGGEIVLGLANFRPLPESLEPACEMADAALTNGPPPVGRHVALWVADSGRGMTRAVLENAFEPFFTTKPVGQGSGLGLSMVQGFTSQSGGSVRLCTSPGQGTRVTLFFPAAEVATDTMEPRPTSALAVAGRPEPQPERDPRVLEPLLPGLGEGAAPMARRRSRILLAEDEDEVRAMLVRSLERAGYEVMAAENGDVAIAMFRRVGGFDLILTDLVMPGKRQGADLIREVRRELPRMPAIELTGYALDDPDMPEGPADEIDGPQTLRLGKPIGRSELLDSVARLLDRHSD